MPEYHILYTTDENYFPHMLTSIYSILENNKEDYIKIHIIFTGFTRVEDKLLNQVIQNYKNVQIELYDIEKIFPLMQKFNIPKWRECDIANARLFYHELLPHIKKLLYLDSDTLVINKLKTLFKKEYNEPLCAVREISAPPNLKKYLSEYYNSGVLLFNSTLWEKEECLKQIYDTLKKLKIELLYPDQDLLNLSLEKRIGTLNLEYNLYPLIATALKYPKLSQKFFLNQTNFYSYEEIKEATRKPIILHNLSYLNTRGWEQNKIHPFKEYYFAYRKLWDSHFQGEKNTQFLAHFSNAPFLSLFTKTYLGEDVHGQIKKLINKKK